MRQLGQDLGIPIKVYGPETHITAVVPMALGTMPVAPEYCAATSLSRQVRAWQQGGGRGGGGGWRGWLRVPRRGGDQGSNVRQEVVATNPGRGRVGTRAALGHSGGGTGDKDRPIATNGTITPSPPSLALI